MIKINNLDKYYFKRKSNEIHVLNGVSLELDSVGFTTILGPSGSGKSTLLHVIGGLDKASGSISYDEFVFDKLCGHKMDLYRNKKIGYIFQNYHLIPELTVYQNLKVQLDLIDVKDPIEVDKRIDTCLKVVGMDKYKRRNVTALSGGQQQRVAIARALVKGANVIIADEPTGNLDSKNSIEVMNILKSLSNRCLVLLVTHDQTLAKHYSDRIIGIRDGKIISDELNESLNTYLMSDYSNIYLDKYCNEVLSNENHKVSLYTDGKQNIELKIVIVNNEIYIENANNMSIKVIGQTTDKVLVDKTPDSPLTKDVVDSFVFNEGNSLRFKDKFINLFNVIKSSMMAFFFAKRKYQIVHFSFLFIGILLCFCLSSLNYSTSIDNEVLREYYADSVKVSAKNARVDSL